jgi:glycosyltransferase involved in cell wall biosynthesis
MTAISIVEILFWASFALVAWTYFGYMLTLKLISVVYVRKIRKQDIEPAISIVITAYNEEALIAEKIENSLSLDYPADKMEIIVVSDASDDQTDEIVKTYADRGIRLLRMPERNGKHFGQGRGIREAANEIVVLTDATTFLEKDAIRKIVRNFADQSIGCVSGEDKINTADSDSAGEGAYVRYEMKLRQLEYRVGSLVGVSGSFFAVRKQMCDVWFDFMSSDFYLPILTRMKGYRTVAEPEAFGYYEVLRNPQKEFQRKVRTVVHGLEVLFHLKGIMNIFKYRSYSIQIISHKLCRWLVPVGLAAMLVFNAVLTANGLFYQSVFVAQTGFYMLALIGYWIEPLRRSLFVKIPLFFTMVNLSILVAWYKYLTGQEFVVWDVTKR